MTAWFELMETSTGLFRFSLVAPGNQVVLSSEMYRSKKGAQIGIEAVQKNRFLPERYRRKASSSGDHYFTLLAGNGEIIGISEMYSTELDRDRGIVFLQRGSTVDAPIHRSLSDAPGTGQKATAFISHDSRDKGSLVRELAFEMVRFNCPVWYDEYSLGVGDSLRESIERGLREADKCVVVLSPNFLSNSGWGQREFDSVFTREIVEKRRVFLPVWHNVTVRDVYAYSPSLADRVALDSSLGVPELARRLVVAIRQTST